MNDLSPLPLSLDALPPTVQKFANPDAPGPAKMMASKGMVPAKGGDLLMVLVQLAHDGDQNIAKSAEKSLIDLPDPVLLPACSTEMPASILDHLAIKFSKHADVLQAIALNASTSPLTIERMARSAPDRLCELIALNEERVLAYPKIIEALYKNANTRMSTADRLVELASRHNLELGGIPSFREHADALKGQLLPEPSDEPLPSDNIFAEALELDEDNAEVFEKGENEDAAEQISEKFKPLSFRIATMTAPEKMRLSLVGDASARALLIKDNNKQVAMAAIKSPKMGDKEAATIATSREVGEEILRYIANRKEWTRSYEVKKSLIFNPKTPVGISLRFLGHMRANDLKTLSKSKGVAGPIKSAALQRMQKKQKG